MYLSVFGENSFLEEKNQKFQMFIKSLKISKYFKNNPIFPCIDYARINFSKHFSKLQNMYGYSFLNHFKMYKII